MRKDGIVKHGDLVHIWAKFRKGNGEFGSNEPLSQRKDIGSVFAQCWPKDPPFDRSVQIERIVKFSVVPGELVSRLLVQLHPFIQKSLVGKSEVVIAMEGGGNSSENST